MNWKLLSLIATLTLSAGLNSCSTPASTNNQLNPNTTPATDAMSKDKPDDAMSQPGDAMKKPGDTMSQPGDAMKMSQPGDAMKKSGDAMKKSGDAKP